MDDKLRWGSYTVARKMKGPRFVRCVCCERTLARDWTDLFVNSVVSHVLRLRGSKTGDDYLSLSVRPTQTIPVAATCPGLVLGCGGIFDGLDFVFVPNLMSSVLLTESHHRPIWVLETLQQVSHTSHCMARRLEGERADEPLL